MPRLLKPPRQHYDLPFRFFTLIGTGFFAFFLDSAAADAPLPLTLPPRAVFFSAAVFGFPFPAVPAGLADADV